MKNNHIKTKAKAPRLSSKVRRRDSGQSVLTPNSRQLQPVRPISLPIERQSLFPGL